MRKKILLGDYIVTTDMVSVIVPCYNCSEFVDRFVQSIRSQTYKNLQVIAVDDGSTDGTRAELEKHSSFLTVITKENGGAASARNVGLNASKGAYVAFLDADDFWLPNKIAAQVQYLGEHPEAGAVYCDWFVCSDESGVEAAISTCDSGFGDISPPPAEQSGWIYNLLLMDCVVHTSSILIKKSQIDRIGYFDETLINGQDYDYWFRLSRIAQIHKIDAKLSGYVLHGNNSTVNQKNTCYEYAVLSKAINTWGLSDSQGNFSSRAEVNRRLAGCCFDFSWISYKNKEYRLAFDYSMKSILHDHFSLKAYVRLVISGAMCIIGRRGSLARNNNN